MDGRCRDKVGFLDGKQNGKLLLRHLLSDHPESNVHKKIVNSRFASSPILEQFFLFVDFIRFC